MWDLGVSGLRIRAQIEGPSHFRTQVHTVMTEGQVLRTSASGRTTWKKAFKRKDSTRAKKKILCAVFTSENQDYFFFANLCNFKGLITQKLNQYDFLNLPVLAALEAFLKFGPHHVPGLLLLHGILNSEHE